MDRLEREGKSKDYIDGTLEGMSFVLEHYMSMKKLEAMKERIIEEEFYGSTKGTI